MPVLAVSKPPLGSTVDRFDPVGSRLRSAAPPFGRTEGLGVGRCVYAAGIHLRFRPKDRKGYFESWAKAARNRWSNDVEGPFLPSEARAFSAAAR